MNIRRGGFAAVVAAAGAAAALSACSSVQPSIGQYAIVTGQGSFSDQQVKNVVDPGQHINVGGSDTTWYLPAQVRNYVTGVNGDRSQPQAEFTAKGDSAAAMSVYAYTYVAFQLNPSHQVLKAFFPFCLKYGCASQTAQTTSDNSGQVRSSTPGWNAMLGEVFPRAIDNATQDALADYGPSLWTTQGDWIKFGDKIASYLPAELHKMTGTNVNYFCGSGSTASHCAPFVVLVNRVVPSDPGVAAAYNQQVTAQYQEEAGAARLRAAKSVYGPDANWFLGVSDLIDKCQARGADCNIYVGNAPAHP